MKKIIVTGAAGFLGGRLATFLGEHYREFNVLATSRRNSNTIELESKACKFISGDLIDPDFCNTLVQNADIVVHCAAFSSPYGDYKSFYNCNYVATENLLKACRSAGVLKFVYISTPSIYVNYKSRFNVKESDPLPKKMVNFYAETKLMAEKFVLANNSDTFQTIALRPRAIIGAGDTVVFPRVLEAYNQGTLKIIGDGKNICDLTSVRNVIEAVICCINAKPEAYGEAYNITNDEPLPFWETLNYTLKSLGLEAPTSKVPKSLALFAAGIIELKAKIMKDKDEPSLLRYSVGVLADSFTLDISKAKENLNYKPQISTFETIDEFVDWYKELNK